MQTNEAKCGPIHQARVNEDPCWMIYNFLWSSLYGMFVRAEKRAEKALDQDRSRTQKLHVAKVVYSNIITSHAFIVHCLDGYIHHIHKSLNI